MSKALILAMTGCKIPRRYHERGVCWHDSESSQGLRRISRQRFGAPFRRHRRGDGGSTIELLERVNLNPHKTVKVIHMNKIIGDKYVSRTNRVHQCSFITVTPLTATNHCPKWGPTQRRRLRPSSMVNVEAENTITGRQ